MGELVENIFSGVGMTTIYMVICILVGALFITQPGLPLSDLANEVHNMPIDRAWSSRYPLADLRERKKASIEKNKGITNEEEMSNDCLCASNLNHFKLTGLKQPCARHFYGMFFIVAGCFAALALAFNGDFMVMLTCGLLSGGCFITAVGLAGTATHKAYNSVRTNEEMVGSSSKQQEQSEKTEQKQPQLQHKQLKEKEKAGIAVGVFAISVYVVAYVIFKVKISLISGLILTFIAGCCSIILVAILAKANVITSS